MEAKNTAEATDIPTQREISLPLVKVRHLRGRFVLACDAILHTPSNGKPSEEVSLKAGDAIHIITDRPDGSVYLRHGSTPLNATAEEARQISVEDPVKHR